jgi:hypothetical protein
MTPKQRERYQALVRATVAINDRYAGMLAGDATLDRDQWSRDMSELGLRVAVALDPLPAT